jgi:hypothetical protein
MAMGEAYTAKRQETTDLNRQRAASAGQTRKAQEEWLWPGQGESRSPAEREANYRRYQLEMESLLHQEQAADTEAQRIARGARTQLAEKLAYDVRQLIWSRVEARRNWPIKWINRNV